MQLKKNDEIDLDITGTTHDGSGVGRCGGLVVFVPNCAEGDAISAKVLSVKKDIAYAKLIHIIKPSDDRVPPDCPVYSSCGGCAFRHISYRKELEIKYRRVRDTLSRIGHVKIEPEPILGSAEIDAYRNKAQYPIGLQGGKTAAGFYARHSHRIISHTGCALQPKAFEDILNAVLRWIDLSGATVYDESSGTGLIRHVYLRQARNTGEIMVCIVANGSSVPAAEALVESLRGLDIGVVSVLLNVNRSGGNVILGKKCVTLWGKDHLTDVLGGIKFEISPLAFYQVNSGQAERLYSIAGEFAGLDGSGLLLDLYCGTGTIGLFLSGLADKVIGVEEIPEAVEDARKNAEINGITNAEFICADAGQAAGRLRLEGLRPDVVVVDPPRKGCSAETLDAVASMEPQKIVYVSCDPATLARDMAYLGKMGYECRRVKPVDMFPRTSHVETVVLMTKAELN